MAEIHEEVCGVCDGSGYFEGEECDVCEGWGEIEIELEVYGDFERELTGWNPQ